MQAVTTQRLVTSSGVGKEVKLFLVKNDRLFAMPKDYEVLKKLISSSQVGFFWIQSG
jgi:hypothetical protein